MNIQNLNADELKQLQSLLNKMNPTQPTELDPVEKMIDDIMDEFNFAKVQNVMDHLDWKWVGEYVTIEMLREEAERLLRGAIFARLHEYRDWHWEQGIHHCTGGFEATAFCDQFKSKITGLELKFVLSSWDESIEDQYDI
jgi:hypothetical protein